MIPDRGRQHRITFDYMRPLKSSFMKQRNTKWLLPGAFMTALIVLFSQQALTAQTPQWRVPGDAANQKNPVPDNSATVNNGKVLYQSYCAPCHGNKGRGDGPAAASLHPKPADHTSGAVQAETDGTLFYKMSEGLSGTAMPPFKAVLHDDQRWAIVRYMRTLSR